MLDADRSVELGRVDEVFCLLERIVPTSDLPTAEPARVALGASAPSMIFEGDMSVEFDCLLEEDWLLACRRGMPTFFHDVGKVRGILQS